MADIAKYTVRLEAETAKYEKALKKANGKLDQFNKRQSKQLKAIANGFKTVAKAAVVGFAGVTASAIKLTGSLDRIAKKAKEANIGAETFQAWEFAATQSGVAVEQFSAALGRANRRIGLFATDGSGPAAKSLERLNIAVRDVNGNVRGQEAIIRDYVKSLEGLSSQAEKTAEITALFGDDARQLALVFGEGSDTLAAFEEQARNLGIVIGGETLASAEAFTDQMDILSRTLKASLSKNMKDLLPSFTRITAALVDITKEGADTKLFFEAINVAMLKTTELGLRVSTAFVKIGRTIGGIGAAISQAVSGDFSAASATLEQLTEDNLASAAKLEAAIAKLQGGGGGAGGGPLGGGGIGGALGGATPGGAEAGPGAADEKRLKQVVDVNQAILASTIQTTKDAVGAWDAYVFRQAEANQEALDKIQEKNAEARDNFSQLFGDNMVQAANNGFDDILKSWAKTLQQMAAKAISSKIFDLLSGIGGGGAGSFGGFFSGLFGGGKAAGGPVSSNKSYLVGEKGPELFTPGASGNITPNHAMGGMTINVSAPGADAGVIPRIEAAVERAVAISAQNRLEAKRRGG